MYHVLVPLDKLTVEVRTPSVEEVLDLIRGIDGESDRTLNNDKEVVNKTIHRSLAEQLVNNDDVTFEDLECFVAIDMAGEIAAGDLVKVVDKGPQWMQYMQTRLNNALNGQLYKYLTDVRDCTSARNGRGKHLYYKLTPIGHALAVELKRLLSSRE